MNEGSSPPTTRRSGGWLALAALVFAAPSAAQNGDGVTVLWSPATPIRGSLVQLVVRPTRLTEDFSPIVSGHLSGQPLHFERDATGAFRTLGGIPIGSTGSIPITISIQISDDSTIHHFDRIPIDSGAFGTEALSVDPRFSAAPDSALRARIDRESAAAVRVYRNAHNSPRRWDGSFERPLPGRITSPFGKGRVFNGEIRSRHTGTDFDGDPGDSVRVVNHGVVAMIGAFYYAGNVVYVDHGFGLVTVYMHLSEVGVAVGDIVSTGDVIGLVGATGRVTGPHLHLQAKYGTVTVNALDLFEVDASLFRVPAQ